MERYINVGIPCLLDKMKLKLIISVFILVLMVGVFSFFYFSNQVGEVKLGNVKIPSDDFKDLTEQIGEGHFLLCDIPENECVISGKYNLDYQGPVPEGYDEEYFRETGITKLEDVKDGP